MNHRYLYLWVVLLAAMVVSCQDDFHGEFGTDNSVLKSGSVVTLVSERGDGVINLSMNAPLPARSNVWIDLDGDGNRNDDGSEDVKTFNAYREYTLAAGVKRVSVHGDITYIGGASNELTEIDVSKNPYLTVLNVPLNGLTSIDVSKNTALTHLDCSGNQIQSLEVSSNIALVSLWVFNNKLSAINLSNNHNLQLLDCSGNKLSALDLSENPQLKQLLCYNNSLSKLDVSGKEELHRIWLFGNPLCGNSAEVEKLLSSLNETINGELWIGEAGTTEESSPVRAAGAKGWAIE